MSHRGPESMSFGDMAPVSAKPQHHLTALHPVGGSVVLASLEDKKKAMDRKLEAEGLAGYPSDAPATNAPAAAYGRHVLTELWANRLRKDAGKRLQEYERANALGAPVEDLQHLATQ